LNRGAALAAALALDELGNGLLAVTKTAPREVSSTISCSSIFMRWPCR
jgi:hypothetical protein